MKSTPMVERRDSENTLSTNRLSMEDLPTAESPTKTILTSWLDVLIINYKYFENNIVFKISEMIGFKISPMILSIRIYD